MKTKTEDRLVFLRGKRTTLRPVCEKDASLLQKWINDPGIRPFLKRVLPVGEGEEREWVDRCTKKSDTDIVLMIEANGKPIGTMGIHRIDWKNRVATTGAMLGEKRYWGKGYGTDAKMALLKYAFDTLNLRKIMSRVKAFNKRSLHYSLHCGYKIEGRLKKQLFVDGKYHDEIILGLFREDWLPYWKKYQK